MSHEILYSRAFVKTSHGIIPMVQIGSSNCTEYHNGREVLERYWDVFNDQLVGLSEYELMPVLYSMYSNTSSGYFLSHGKWITNIPTWFKSGIRTAGTLEQYALTNPHISLKCWIDVRERGVDYRGYELNTHKEIFPTYCHSTTDLDSWLDKALQYMSEQHPDNISAHMRFDFGKWESVKAAAIQNKPVIVKCKSGYITRYETNRSLSFSHDISKAVVFDDPEDAILKIGNCWDGLSFVKAGSKIEKPYAVFVESGNYCGSWVCRVTAYNMSFTSFSENTVMRFKSEKDAQKYIINKIVPRFGTRVGTCVARKIKEDADDSN